MSLKSEELKVNEDDQSKLMSQWKGPWSCSLHALLCFSNGFLSVMMFQSFHNLIKKKYMNVCHELFISPQCGMGDRCAMKFGPRIGKLCDCGRGANCNSYLLKCIWGAFFSFFTITASLLQDSRHPSRRLSSFHRLSQTDSTPPISLFISVMHRCLRMSMGFFVFLTVYCCCMWMFHVQ